MIDQLSFSSFLLAGYESITVGTKALAVQGKPFADRIFHPREAEVIK